MQMTQDPSFYFVTLHTSARNPFSPSLKSPYQANVPKKEKCSHASVWPPICFPLQNWSGWSDNHEKISILGQNQAFGVVLRSTTAAAFKSCTKLSNTCNSRPDYPLKQCGQCCQEHHILPFNPFLSSGHISLPPPPPPPHHSSLWRNLLQEGLKHLPTLLLFRHRGNTLNSQKSSLCTPFQLFLVK